MKIKETSSFAVDELLVCLGTGREHAKTDRFLAQLMDTGKRRVRKLIEMARRDGYPIVAGENGYFLPDLNEPKDRAFVERYIAREKRKAETLLANVAFVQRCLDGC